MQNIHIIDISHDNDYAEAAPIPVEYDYNRFISCPECGRRISGAYWVQPREVVLTKRKTPDFLYNCCDNAPILLSENALTKIVSAGFSGILRAVEIENVRFQRKTKFQTIPPKYYHIELVRSRITVDHSNSKIRYGDIPYEYTCPLCQQIPFTFDAFNCLSLNLDAYEGYDIFQIYELGNAVFLSERLVRFCRAEKMTNLNCVPTQKYRSHFWSD